MRQVPRHGVVLIAVLVVTAITAMIAGGLMFRVRAEAKASAAVSNGDQAYAACMSGIHRAVNVLTQLEGGRDVWYENPEAFQNQLVFDDGTEQWYFTIYAPSDIDDEQVRYGLIDEGGKISLLTASEETIRNLPGVTEEMADAYLDYRDSDDEPRPFGAEQEYYDALPQPYLIRNGALATIEELLLVRGFNGPVVYGEDANFSGVLDRNEDDGDESFPPDNGDGELDTGLVGLCTVITYGPDLDSDGESRIDLNRADVDELGLYLPQETVDFIIAFREDGGRFTHASHLLEMQHVMSKDSKSVPSAKQGAVIASGVGPDLLPDVLDRYTTSRGGRRPVVGRININTCSPRALQVLAEIDAVAADQIVAVREGLDEEKRRTPAWLYTEGVVDAATFKEVAPGLTATSYQYRVRVIGYGARSDRYRIMEAMIDLGRDTPRLSYVRDLTRLGLPIALDPDEKEFGR